MFAADCAPILIESLMPRGPTALLLASAFLISACLSLPASAQQGGRLAGKHGAWSIVCDTSAKDADAPCVMMQNVIAEDRPDIGISVMVLKGGPDTNVIRVLTPLGSLIPRGIWVYVDGARIGAMLFLRCLDEGCYAEVGVDKDSLAKLTSGKKAVFTVFQSPEEGIGFEVDLSGFAESLQALQSTKPQKS